VGAASEPKAEEHQQALIRRVKDRSNRFGEGFEPLDLSSDPQVALENVFALERVCWA
jgi:hypothetical protein